MIVVPTESGLMVKNVDLPSVAEFQQRVEERAETVDLSEAEVTRLVNETRDSEK